MTSKYETGKQNGCVNILSDKLNSKKTKIKIGHFKNINHWVYRHVL